MQPLRFMDSSMVAISSCDGLWATNGQYRDLGNRQVTAEGNSAIAARNAGTGFGSHHWLGCCILATVAQQLLVMSVLKGGVLASARVWLICTACRSATCAHLTAQALLWRNSGARLSR